MMAEYSEEPLYYRLGIKKGQKVYIKDAPQEYLKDLGSLPDSMFLACTSNKPVDYLHCFYKWSSVPKSDIVKFKQYLDLNGTLQISWSLTPGRTKQTINEHILRAMLVQHNLIDTRLIPLNKSWHAMEFIWRQT